MLYHLNRNGSGTEGTRCWGCFGGGCAWRRGSPGPRSSPISSWIVMMDGWRGQPCRQGWVWAGTAGAGWCLGTEVPWPWGSLPVLWL